MMINDLGLTFGELTFFLCGGTAYYVFPIAAELIILLFSYKYYTITKQIVITQSVTEVAHRENNTVLRERAQKKGGSGI